MDRRKPIQSPQEVLVLCRERDVRAVDLRFTDLFGRQHHTTVPVGRLVEKAFEEGFGFDGSCLRGWQALDESDMLLVPQAPSAWIDPFAPLPTLVLTCDIVDPITREDYSRDPRNVARRAETYLSNSGVADTAHFGPEAEFFIFDDVRYDQTQHSAFFYFYSVEAEWNQGREEGPNLGHKVRYSEGYFPCPPIDQTASLRTEMMQTLIDCGIDVECHHHEAATAGQAEIDVRFDTLLAMADTMMNYKYIIKSVARRNGKTVTFMPQPIAGDNGNGMHVHLSLWRANEPLFAGNGYAGLSDAGLHAIGGILRHAPALLAFTNPTTNSYKRLVPGSGAPVNLSYSQRNRSAACRVPMVSPSPKSKRVEFRCPDPSCNPYLAFAAILMAVIDGIQNKIHPGDALDRDLYELPTEVLQGIPQVPRSLESALEALEDDCDFLLRGDVFTEDILRVWIESKRKFEIEPLAMRPHPFEFSLYYDS